MKCDEPPGEVMARKPQQMAPGSNFLSIENISIDVENQPFVEDFLGTPSI